jgi:hypothetical protein
MDSSSQLDLASLLLLNANSHSHDLTKEQMIWVDAFIKASPESFTNLVSDIKSITSDGKINLQDIPKIIKLLSDVYDSKAKILGLSNPKNIIFFIKFTIDVILESKLLPLDSVEASTVEYIVDSSLDLLANNLSTIEEIMEEIEEAIHGSLCEKICDFFCRLFLSKYRPA